MIKTIPLLPFPYKPFRKLIRGFYPLASLLLNFFPELDIELDESDSQLNSKEYISGALLSFTFYFFVVGAILAIGAYRNNLLGDLNARLVVVSFALVFASATFFYTLLIPKWMSSKKKLEMEKNLLFATRHLMIQTSAGVPLFDSIVSISEEYGDPRLNYGQISKEFKKIVKEVRGGKELSNALEESAERNPSSYYKRVIWQLANANKAGANIGFVLKEVVEFLSDEQRIMIRNYGSQLNPLALFYMLTCVIAPTMGLIFLTIATTVVDIPINEMTFGLILIVLVVIQIMFIGLIKSRRPTVAF